MTAQMIARQWAECAPRFHDFALVMPMWRAMKALNGLEFPFMRLSWPLPLLRPTVFFAAGASAFAMLAISVYADSQRAADRLLALRRGSPAAIALRSFDPTAHIGPAGELVVRAQVDASLPLQVMYRDGVGHDRALVYPLVAIDAVRGATDAPILGYFFVELPPSQAEILDFANIMPPYEKVGAYGPIVTLNGELGVSEQLSEHVATLLAGVSRPTVADLVGIRPYPEGRAVALSAPRPSPWRFVWVTLGLVFFGAGSALGRFLPILAERRRTAEIANAGRKRSGVAPTPETDKGRLCLAPLAPQPDPRRVKRSHGPLTSLMIEGWHQMRDQSARNRR
ncbi:hypothetical protein [Oceaniglobus ichthyenteri]|uniref:hypothetical protein n=1 Tax=Oceaniglobus ichthyenteri TaxID=2136177 RepID=UPI000D389D31|nr:hypothetical protein [Oceaniglobus ichthyenteri]